MSPADSGSGGLIRDPTGPHKLLPLWEHPFADMFAAGDGQRKRALLLAFVRHGIGAAEPVRIACRDTVKALARAGSPFIYRILEVRRIQDGRLVLAGDLLEGTTVGQHLLDGALGPARSIAILRQLCHALDAAHGRGIMHGALSVASVILGSARGRDDAVRLTDFGLAGEITAQSMGDHEAEIQPLSPERIAGGAPSVRDDIYLLGAVGYAMLAGEPMFAGTASDVRSGHAKREPARLDVPKPLAAVVERCVAKAPADRFGSMRELERALLDAQRELGIETAWDDLPARADVSAHGVPAALERDPSQPNPIAAKIPSGPFSVIGGPRTPARALAESSGAVRRGDLEGARRPSPSAKPAASAKRAASTKPAAAAKPAASAKPAAAAKPEPAIRRIPPAPALRPPPTPIVARPAAASEASGPAPKLTVPPPPSTPRASGHKWSRAPKPGAASGTGADAAPRRATALGIDLSRPVRRSEGRLPLPPEAIAVRRTGAGALTPGAREGSEVSGPGDDATPRPASEAETSGAATDATATDAKTTGAKATDATTDAKATDATTDAKATDAKTTDAKTTDAKTTDAKTTDAKTTDAKTTDAKTTDAKTTDAETPEPESSAVVRPRAASGDADRRTPVPGWMLAAAAALVIGVPLLLVASGDDASEDTEYAARTPEPKPIAPKPENHATPTPTPTPSPAPAPAPAPVADDGTEPAPEPGGDDAGIPPEPDGLDLVIDESAGDDAAAVPEPTPPEEAPTPKPATSTSARDRAAQLVASAKKAHSSGKLDRAESLYKQALAAYSRSHTAAAGLGLIYFNRSQWGKSATYYGKAVAAAPGSSEYRIRLGDAYFKDGKYQQARASYLRAKRMGNKSAAARIAKADAKLGR